MVLVKIWVELSQVVLVSINCPLAWVLFYEFASNQKGKNYHTKSTTSHYNELCNKLDYLLEQSGKYYIGMWDINKWQRRYILIKSCVVSV